MPDSSAIDNALQAKLGIDAALLALMPNGVHIDVAPSGSTKFVVISLLSALDTKMFQGRAYESVLYLVKAVANEVSGANVQAAAARIDELLEQGTMNVTGYTVMSMSRVERVRYIEPTASGAAPWHHRGGQYEVVVSST